MNKQYFPSVDWNSHEITFNSLNYCEQVRTTKAMYSWMLVTLRLHRFNKHTHPTNKYPICNEAQETTDHLYSYQHFSSKTIRKPLLDKMKNWQKKFKMNPHVFNPVIKHLYATLQQKPLHLPDSKKKIKHWNTY